MHNVFCSKHNALMVANFVSNYFLSYECFLTGFVYLCVFTHVPDFERLYSSQFWLTKKLLKISKKSALHRPPLKCENEPDRGVRCRAEQRWSSILRLCERLMSSNRLSSSAITERLSPVLFACQMSTVKITASTI